MFLNFLCLSKLFFSCRPNIPCFHICFPKYTRSSLSVCAASSIRSCRRLWVYKGSYAWAYAVARYMDIFNDLGRHDCYFKHCIFFLCVVRKYPTSYMCKSDTWIEHTSSCAWHTCTYRVHIHESSARASVTRTCTCIITCMHMQARKTTSAASRMHTYI